jgi:hypothetical protein
MSFKNLFKRSREGLRGEFIPIKGALSPKERLLIEDIYVKLSKKP